MPAKPSTRKMTIIAQDPSVLGPNKGILRTQVGIAYEDLAPGPKGYRVHVVDYDASQRVLYKPALLDQNAERRFARASDARLLNDPAFHCQNVYAIVMRVLERFEFALGRRVSWGFGGHQIHVFPHAFADANAYYSEEDHALFFGYFAGSKGDSLFNCLSHDIVAHETSHALLDGLRDSFTFPSHPDQAGFHEGFADIIALLSVFSSLDVVRKLLPETARGSNKVRAEDVGADALRHNVLLGLAEQYGKEATNFRENVLRRSAAKVPQKGALEEPPYEECHLRGEILTAAVLNAFIAIWRKRLKSWLPGGGISVSRERVAEDGADAAEHLLTMVIRALDYCPVVDVTYKDFLCALLTADRELWPDDGKYKYRPALLREFERWGISPASIKRPWAVDPRCKPDRGKPVELGGWERPKEEEQILYDCVHHESLERDPSEVFRFLWENRHILRFYADSYTRVTSVWPILRISPDGFSIRETVSEYFQILDLEARQLLGLNIRKPDGMPDNTPIRLLGGGVLIFDEFGSLKYHIRSRLDNADRQERRLEYLWKNDIKDRDGRYGFSDGLQPGRRFATMHLRRAKRIGIREDWDE